MNCERGGRLLELSGLLARLAVGAVFLVSGLHKAGAPAQEFAVVIEGYRLLPQGLVLPLAAALPWLEVFLGLCLVSGYRSRRASGAAVALFLTFMAALASTKLRGIALANCGCFGGGIHLTQLEALGLDTLLTLTAYWSYRRGAVYAPLDAWINRGGPPERKVWDKKRRS